MAIEPITRLNIERPTQVCKKCGTKKDLNDFYTNSKWEENKTKDCWCKECVKGLSAKEEVRKYFWENNRYWDEKIWTAARENASKIVLNNAIYKKADSAQQALIFEKLSSEQVSLLMNKPAYYRYECHDGKAYEAAKSDGQICDMIDEGVRKYDKEWNGYYTNNELEFLNNFYNQICEEREIESFTERLYVRNWAKSALTFDKAQDALNKGEGAPEDVQKAAAVMDTVAKTGQLAPKKKEDKGEGLSSVAEISLYLIQHGHPMTRKIEWPEDQVDAVSKDFAYLPVALGLQDM